MTVKSYKFQEGTLLLGTGAPFDVSPQMRAVTVAWSENVSTIDAIPVLSGEEIAEEEDVKFNATLAGTFLQDLDLDGIVEWSYNNKGLETPFVFVPDNPTERGVQGVCKPIPIDVGGEIARPANRPTSDFTWRCIGEPIFGVYDEVEDLVEDDV